jgi:hypothetical protein
MVKLTNLWENWAVVRENCGILAKSKFDKAVYPGTGIRNVSPEATIDMVLDLFTKFPQFRSLFEGYHEIDSDNIANALKDPLNRAKIAEKIKTEWANQMFNGHSTWFIPAEPDDIGYDAVRDGLDKINIPGPIDRSNDTIEAKDYVFASGSYAAINEDGTSKTDDTRNFYVRINPLTGNTAYFNLPFTGGYAALTQSQLEDDGIEVSYEDLQEAIDIIDRDFYKIRGGTVGETKSEWISSLNDYAEVTEVDPDGEEYMTENERQFNVIMRRSGDESSYHYFADSYAGCKDANGNDWEPEQEIIDFINLTFISPENADDDVFSLETAAAVTENIAGVGSVTIEYEGSAMEGDDDEDTYHKFSVSFNDTGETHEYFFLDGEINHVYDEYGDNTVENDEVAALIQKNFSGLLAE